MFHLDAWHTAVTIWEAIGLLWLITAAFDRSLVQSSVARSSTFRFHLLFLLPAVLLLFYPRPLLGFLGWTILQSDIAGLALVIAGAAFAGLARLALGANWSSNPRIRAGHTLSTAGPYRFVRHPIYSGLLLAALGTAVIVGSIRAYIAVLLAFIGFLLKSRMEDRLLAARFGSDFDTYRRRTRALIPGIL